MKVEPFYVEIHPRIEYYDELRRELKQLEDSNTLVYSKNFLIIIVTRKTNLVHELLDKTLDDNRIEAVKVVYSKP